VNNAVFGKVLGVLGNKKENDSTKIGSIWTGEHKILHKTGGEIDDISAIMKKISFKEKKKKNNCKNLVPFSSQCRRAAKPLFFLDSL
jgi:hypothetical protein